MGELKHQSHTTFVTKHELQLSPFSWTRASILQKQALPLGSSQPLWQGLQECLWKQTWAKITPEEQFSGTYPISFQTALTTLLWTAHVLGLGLSDLGLVVVVTPPSPFPQVAGGAPQAPASTTVCVRTTSVATPAPVLRATRERTVLSVRHHPLHHLLLSQGVPVNHTQLPCDAPYYGFGQSTQFWAKQGWCVVPAYKTSWHPEVLQAAPVPWASLLQGCSKRDETKPPYGYSPKPALPLPPALPGCLSCCGPRCVAWRTKAGGFPGTVVPLGPHTPTSQSLRTEGLQNTNHFQWK